SSCRALRRPRARGRPQTAPLRAPARASGRDPARLRRPAVSWPPGPLAAVFDAQVVEIGDRLARRPHADTARIGEGAVVRVENLDAAEIHADPVVLVHRFEDVPPVWVQ